MIEELLLNGIFVINITFLFSKFEVLQQKWGLVVNYHKTPLIRVFRVVGVAWGGVR